MATRTAPPMDEAVLSFFLPKLQLTVNTCEDAARQGHLQALQWLRGCTPQCPWDEWTLIGALEHRHFSIVVWARAQDPPCPWTTGVFSTAVEWGDLSVLQWLSDHGCPWDVEVFRAAAFRGNLSVMQWLRDHQCPWDTSVCSSAAFNGHLAVLQWLRENQCPWDEYTCMDAAQHGHLDLLMWARSQCPPCPWNASVCVATVHGWGDWFPILQWLRACNPPCPWDEQVCHWVADHNAWDIVKWCLERGAPFAPEDLQRKEDLYVRTEFYHERRWLALHYQAAWSDGINGWLQRVTEVSSELLVNLLPRDLVTMVEHYC